MANRSAIHSVAISQGKMASDSNGYPDVDNATWVALGVARAYETYFAGEEQGTTIQVTGEDPYANTPPEVPGVVNTTDAAIFGVAAGAKFQRFQTESIVVRLPVRAPDTGGDFSDLGWHALLETCCKVIQSSAVTTDVAVGGAGAHFGEFTVEAGKGGEFPVGAAVQRIVNGVAHYAFVTEVDTDTVTVTPKWPSAVSDGETLRHMRTYAPRTGAVPDNRLVTVRFDTDGGGRYLFDAVVVGIQSAIEDGALFLDLTIRPADEVSIGNDDPTDWDYDRPLTPPVSPLQACRQWTADPLGTITAPGSTTASGFDIFDYTFGATFNGSPDNGCGSLYEQSSYSYNKSDATVAGTSFNVDALKRSFLNRESRQIVLGFGPPDQGAVFGLMAGHLQQGEGRGSDDQDSQTRDFTFINGGWTGDDSVSNGVDGTSWRLAFAVPDAA